MNPKQKIKAAMIAPCGMNCGLCLAFQREKNHCAGCRGPQDQVFNYCSRCVIRNCRFFKTSTKKYCFSCPQYPCTRMKQLDKRYRTRYKMSMFENLEEIKQSGIRKFIAQENKKWLCRYCGSLLCVHRKACPACGKINRDLPGKK